MQGISFVELSLTRKYDGSDNKVIRKYIEDLNNNRTCNADIKNIFPYELHIMKNLNNK